MVVLQIDCFWGRKIKDLFSFLFSDFLNRICLYMALIDPAPPKTYGAALPPLFPCTSSIFFGPDWLPSLGSHKVGHDWSDLAAAAASLEGFPGGVSVKNLPANAGRHRGHKFDPWVRKIPWRRKWQPTPEFLPGESCGQRSLVGSF